MFWLLAQAGAARADVPVWQQVLMQLTVSDNFSPAEWNAMSFHERLLAHDWKKEAFIVIVFFAFIATHYWGVWRNKSRVNAWLDAARPTLQAQFAQVGVDESRELIRDSNSAYTTYATGRQNVASLLAHFHLIDRQNVILQSIALVVPAAASISGHRDNIDVTISPWDPTAIEPVIFAVVNKEHMQKAREENYYLSLTRTSDSDKLTQHFAFMTEHNDAIETLFTPELAAAVSGAEGILEHFAVTDQRVDAPKSVSDVIPRSRVHVSFKYPRNAADAAKVAQVLDAAVNFVDFLISKRPLKSEAARKIKGTREAEINKLRKAAEALRLEEIEAKKAEERRKAEKETAQLSDKEQRRLQKKQQEKEMRKQQKKMTMRQ